MNNESKNVLLNLSEVLPDNRSSVALAHTTKGTTWKIKVYHKDPKLALKTADELFEQCNKKYGKEQEADLR